MNNKTTGRNLLFQAAVTSYRAIQLERATHSLDNHMGVINLQSTASNPLKGTKNFLEIYLSECQSAD